MKIHTIASKYMLVAAGIILFFWGLIDPNFRSTTGALSSNFCFVISSSVALFIFGLSLNSTWRKSALWLSLAVMGQAAALQLVDAGPYIHFQHYVPFSQLMIPSNLFYLLLIILQGILVIVGIKSGWSKIANWIRNEFKTLHLLIILGVFSITSAILSRQITVYLWEIVFASSLQIICLANVFLFVESLPVDKLMILRQRILRWLNVSEEARQHQKYPFDKVAVIAACWIVFFSATLNVISYQRHPHIPDEVVYIYHSKYFAEGQLTMPLPTIPEAFDVDLMYYGDDRWYSPVPPGWPAMLSVGSLMGISWMVNPILAGLNILLIFFLIKEIYDRKISRWVVILLCCSPWYIFMAMNFMPHTFTLTCALIAAMAVLKMRKKQSFGWALLGGGAIGLVGLVRPLEGLAVAILLGGWAFFSNDWRYKLTRIPILVSGTILVTVIGLIYNQQLTGSPTRFPIMAYTDKYYGPGSNALGFGANRGLGWTGLDPFPGHGILDAVINTHLNLSLLNTELLGWGIGSILLVAIFLFSNKIEKRDYWMLAVILMIIGIHTLYWFSGGPDFGPRYWYLIIVPCMVLTIRGMQSMEKKLSKNSDRVNIGLLSLCLIALINFFPWRAIDKYYHYRGMEPGIRELAEEFNFKKSLVLIRGKRHPDFMSAVVYNPVDMGSNEPLYAWDQSFELRMKLMKAYPDRTIWIVDGPSVTGQSYAIVRGPLTVEELITQDFSEN